MVFMNVVIYLYGVHECGYISLWCSRMWLYIFMVFTNVVIYLYGVHECGYIC